jgi:tetratricopeptide (TPR) repeat protein
MSQHHCTTSLVVTLACFSFMSLAASDAPEISQQATKLNHRGLDYLHKKQYDQAITSFREALQIQPEYPDALENLGKALETTGQDAEAIANFDKVISIAPEKAVVYAEKGLALFHAGKYEEAAASYRQAIEHHPTFSEAQNALGASLLHLGRNDEAVAAFRSSIASNPKNADALGNLGSALLAKEKQRKRCHSYAGHIRSAQTGQIWSTITLPRWSKPGRHTKRSPPIINLRASIPISPRSGLIWDVFITR